MLGRAAGEQWRQAQPVAVLPLTDAPRLWLVSIMAALLAWPCVSPTLDVPPSCLAHLSTGKPAIPMG